MTTRLRDWQGRLGACLAERWARPFEWGVQDCCLFAADCVAAVTGEDPAADLRGQYASAVAALRLQQALGGPEAIAASRLGAEVPVLMAQVGDVGITDGVEGNDLPALVVCGGAHWIGPGAAGLVAVPVGSVRKAWRVGA
ncbi:DUF6950 family protein [Aquincola sp. J276]|uniref:DUF6950 family protein n=1 Tax=Aquincola sp. J276 TaxID=2898432 RepID=UPI002151AA80|nr:hypothetical protein [Aquincola sp. J276]MCR5864645.1 hypothetical protein [Aquincola sp. J276]